jgi:dGTPase
VRVIHELVRRLITRFVEDAFAESRARLAALGPLDVDDIRRADRAMLAFSAPMEAAQKEIKEFLFARMYRHAAILPVWKNAGKIVRGLFDLYMEKPSAMGAEWAEAAKGCNDRARLVADYIAGMTDRYALAQAKKWLDGPGELA